MEEIIKANDYDLPTQAESLVNLADDRLGSHVVACSNEFFGQANRMLNHESAIFIPSKFDDHGKWVDGWETARKREVGYDWSIVKLGTRGIIRLLEVDTSFFTGNYPASVSVEACCVDNAELSGEENWISILENKALQGNKHHFFEIENEQIFTHVRINIFPDGGIARFKVFGEVKFDISEVSDKVINLCLAKYGAKIVAYSDAHFGHPENLLQESSGINMGDGWETARRRGPGFDWCIIKLACPVHHLNKIDIDTKHFKGNYPAQVSIQAAYHESATKQQLIAQSMFWKFLLLESPLSMHQNHEFSNIEDIGMINYIRVNMIPDGGISRVRLWADLNHENN